jgi:predicted O-methyltransferase YrrM
MPTRFQFQTYFTYWLDAVNKHSLHSPFFFDFYTRVVAPTPRPAPLNALESVRDTLLRDTTHLTIQDLGAGPQQGQATSRTVQSIARTSISPERFAHLYHRIVRHFGHAHVIELGTSLGLNALYLATAGAQVTTFEGAPAVAGVARNVFALQPSARIRLIEGDITHTLPAYLASSGKVDLAFVDANHRYEPTVRYFQQLLQKVHAQSMLIFDDIHYTPGMQQAWEEMRKHPLVYASADLYRCGILFFDPSLNKQHVVLQY